MQQRFLLQILLLAQHVSGTTMPIIRSSRVLYSGCCLWYFVLWFSSILQTGHITLSSIPDQQLENHSTKYHRQQPLLSSWWWAYWCPKHVEQTIRSAIKTSVASSWHFISTYLGFLEGQGSGFKVQWNVVSSLALRTWWIDQAGGLKPFHLSGT